MKIPAPGEMGFNAQQFQGQMIRVGIKLSKQAQEIAALEHLISVRFPMANASMIADAALTVTQGLLAAQKLVLTGYAGPEVMAAAPVVPPITFSADAGWRTFLQGDAVAVDGNGVELRRNTVTFGGYEDEELAKLMGEATFEIYQRLLKYDPAEAGDFVRAFFEVYWFGKAF